jgi:hypothetical protein
MSLMPLIYYMHYTNIEFSISTRILRGKKLTIISLLGDSNNTNIYCVTLITLGLG